MSGYDFRDGRALDRFYILDAQSLPNSGSGVSLIWRHADYPETGHVSVSLSVSVSVPVHVSVSMSMSMSAMCLFLFLCLCLFICLFMCLWAEFNCEAESYVIITIF